MRSRLIVTFFGLLAASCLDDTQGLAGGARPNPIPPPPPEEQAGATSSGGSAGSGGADEGGSAGSEPSAGSGAVAPMNTCTPIPELCNGQDDDCDDEADEGCPLDLSWKTSVPRATLGDSPGGSEFTNTCANDELLVGLRVAVGAWVEQVTGVCRRFALEADESETPYAYSFAFQGTRDLPAHPAETNGEINDLLCDEHQALVGLRVAQQNYVSGDYAIVVVTRVWIRCAEPLLDATGSIGWQEPAELGPVSGFIADDTAWFALDELESPDVAVTLHGASGAWLDRLGLGTSSIVVDFR